MPLRQAYMSQCIACHCSLLPASARYMAYVPVTPDTIQVRRAATCLAMASTLLTGIHVCTVLSLASAYVFPLGRGQMDSLLVSVIDIDMRKGTPDMKTAWQDALNKYTVNTMVCSYRRHYINNITVIGAYKSPCGRLQHDDHTPGEMSLLKGEQQYSERQWNVDLRHTNSEAINLTFTQFKMADSLGDCRTESLDIKYRGQNRSVKVCGNLVAWSQCIPVNMFTLVYNRHNSLSLALARTGLFHGKPVSHFTALYEIAERFQPYRKVLEIGSNSFNSKTPFIENKLRDSGLFYTLPTLDTYFHTTIVADIGAIISLAVILQPGNGCYKVYVYDGPDSLSRRLPLRQGMDRYPMLTAHIASIYMYKTSWNWKCDSEPPIPIRFMLLYHLSSDRRRHDTIGGSETRVRYMITKDTILRLPSSICGVACLYSIQTEPGTYIDLHVKYPRVTGPSHGECLSRGLIVYKPKDPSYTKSEFTLAKLCKLVLVTNPRGGQSVKALPDRVTTSGNIVNIAWFNYPPGQLQAEIHLKITKCRGTFVHCLADTTVLPRHTERWKDTMSIVSGESSLTLLPYLYAFTTRDRDQSPPAPGAWLQLYHANQLVTGSGHTIHNHITLNPAIQCAVIQYMPHLHKHPAGSQITCSVTTENSKYFPLNKMANTTEYSAPCEQGYIDTIASYRTDAKCSFYRLSAERENPTFSAVNIRHIENIQRVWRSVVIRPRFAEYFTDSDFGVIRFRAENPVMVAFQSQIPLIRNVGDFSLFSMVLDYVTSISVNLDGPPLICDSVGVILALIHHKPTDSLRRRPSINWYKFQLTRQEKATYYDIQVFHKRLIAIQLDRNDTRGQADCLVRITTNPLVPLSKLVPSMHIDTSSVSHDFGGGTDLFYVVWRSQNAESISWTDAEQTCQMTDGHLPDVTSAQHLSMLQNLILGSAFAQNGKYLFSPTRQEPRIHLYIGLMSDSSQVGSF